MRSPRTAAGAAWVAARAAALSVGSAAAPAAPFLALGGARALRLAALAAGLFAGVLLTRRCVRGVYARAGAGPQALSLASTWLPLGLPVILVLAVLGALLGSWLGPALGWSPGSVIGSALAFLAVEFGGAAALLLAALRAGEYADAGLRRGHRGQD